MRANLPVFAVIIGLLTAPASAATYSLLPTADGDVRTFGGDAVDTTTAFISVSQSGGNINNGVLVYDLSPIPDTASILSARLDVTLNRFISNTPALNPAPAAVDLFVFAGDGTVDISDYSATGTQVFDDTTPAGGTGGDVRSFTFTDVTSLESLLGGNLATIRFETDSFASLQFASNESSLYSPATLVIETETTPIPLPGGLPLLAAALGVTAVVKRRRSLR
ncbi:MAG: VPLPA-CTERM sorting domain-containing protein [Paracoccaceae bacterium]|jgi:hypothetical protein|nr:VPLPA-CTERM sorting domain-containing protein [Paracoccaceae bacterium]